MARIRSAWGHVRPKGGGGVDDGQLVEPWRGGAGDALEADVELAGEETVGSTGLCMCAWLGVWAGLGELPNARLREVRAFCASMAVVSASSRSSREATRLKSR